ncbi:MAG: LPXTG cell wall anchor domain-containing protein [Nocardioides sp.]
MMFSLAAGVAPASATTVTTGGSTDYGSTTTSGTSGDPTEPQPDSTADQNDGGANGDCPDGGSYCSTRDGSPSANGAGDGTATGKPCAGCVGKADNKNPQGQGPDGSDRNAGYECDSNQGVGQGNPAHTGCTSDASTAGTADSSADAGSTAPVVAGTSATAGPGQPDGATPGADAPGADRPPVVAGVEAFAAPREGAQRPAGAAAVVAAAAGLLPNTGAGAALLGAGVAGLALLAVGTSLVLRRRRLEA